MKICIPSWKGVIFSWVTEVFALNTFIFLLKVACEAKNGEAEAQFGTGNTWRYTGQPTSSENFDETAHLQNILIYVSCWIMIVPA